MKYFIRLKSKFKFNNKNILVVIKSRKIPKLNPM